MPGKQRVLFVCVHNSARSQMAEAYLKQLAGDRFEVESAGLEPGNLNPLAVEVMREVGMDISHNKTKDVFDLFRQGRMYSYVITVCDESRNERCPLFPGVTQRLHWDIADPSALSGSWEEKLEQTREIRDQIKRKIERWIDEEKKILIQ
ncbi:MAG: arsenate reductase ArsC [Candidatus Omnitrophica bacterium]|nr:arsenate reductase ArsC [Candidatus Omnitrophota bacterium]